MLGLNNSFYISNSEESTVDPLILSLFESVYFLACATNLIIGIF